MKPQMNTDKRRWEKDIREFDLLRNFFYLRLSASICG